MWLTAVQIILRKRSGGEGGGVIIGYFKVMSTAQGLLRVVGIQGERGRGREGGRERERERAGRKRERASIWLSTHSQPRIRAGGGGGGI